MLIFNELLAKWWVVLISFVVVLAYLRVLHRSFLRHQLADMRSEGLTDQDIIDIIGAEGYRKLINA